MFNALRMVPNLHHNRQQTESSLIARKAYRKSASGSRFSAVAL